jgi:hypothetical protein
VKSQTEKQYDENHYGLLTFLDSKTNRPVDDVFIEQWISDKELRGVELVERKISGKASAEKARCLSSLPMTRTAVTKARNL